MDLSETALFWVWRDLQIFQSGTKPAKIVIKLLKLFLGAHAQTDAISVFRC